MAFRPSSIPCFMNCRIGSNLDLTCESGGRLSTTTPSCNEVPKNVCRRVSWSSRAIRARSSNIRFRFQSSFHCQRRPNELHFMERRSNASLAFFPATPLPAAI